MGVFIDWGSLYQKDPALFDSSETPEAKPEAERAAFEADLKAKRKFYGGEAYEKSRSPEEKAGFLRSLEETMDVWYAHQMIVSLFATLLPDWYTAKADARVYESRGWTFFERSSAELIRTTGI